MLPWWPILGLSSWSPIFKSRPCNSFEDQVPVDFIYGYLIFKWVAGTWQGWEGTRSSGRQATCPIVTILRPSLRSITSLHMTSSNQCLCLWLLWVVCADIFFYCCQETCANIFLLSVLIHVCFLSQFRHVLYTVIYNFLHSLITLEIKRKD